MSTHARSPETRAAAIADYQAGLTMDQVATKHGISSSCVWRWLNIAGVERRPSANVRKNRHCSVEGCDLPHASRGYCNPHYQREVRIKTGRQVIDKAARIEDCRWMASTGEGLAGAARRIGISSDALWSWLKRYDFETLAVLTAQDPLPLNTSRATFHGAGRRVTA